jgi:hypothetical protein
VRGTTLDCSDKSNNLLQRSLHCIFCSNRCNGRPGIAKPEKIAVQGWIGKKKPPEGGFCAK